ncbi:hypothetical protein ACTMU2_01795 [Cupriavidus basilensis]
MVNWLPVILPRTPVSPSGRSVVIATLITLGGPVGSIPDIEVRCMDRVRPRWVLVPTFLIAWRIPSPPSASHQRNFGALCVLMFALGMLLPRINDWLAGALGHVIPNSVASLDRDQLDAWLRPLGRYCQRLYQRNHDGLGMGTRTDFSGAGGADGRSSLRRRRFGHAQ